jgi:hypothetical protein
MLVSGLGSEPFVLGLRQRVLSAFPNLSIRSDALVPVEQSSTLVFLAVLRNSSEIYAFIDC